MCACQDGAEKMNYVSSNLVEGKIDRVKSFVIELEGFEGPLHLLLDLCRSQKIDLRTISLVQLADQYLKFISEAKKLRIELAADYLIMAAWLVYLKSEILIPVDSLEDENDAEELTNNLKFQLLKLDAMRNAAVTLMSGDQLNRDFFGRGYQETENVTRRTVHRAALIDLLRAYASLKTREHFEPLYLKRSVVLMPDEAFRNIREQLESLVGWQTLESFSVKAWKKTRQRRRSATATNLAVFLELAKLGEVEIAQNEVFSPILVKKHN